MTRLSVERVCLALGDEGGLREGTQHGSFCYLNSDAGLGIAGVVDGCSMIAERGCRDGTFKTCRESILKILYHLIIRLRLGKGFPFMEVEVGGQRELSTPKIWLAASCHPSIDIQHACVVGSAVCCTCAGDACLLLQG